MPGPTTLGARTCDATGKPASCTSARSPLCHTCVTGSESENLTASDGFETGLLRGFRELARHVAGRSWFVLCTHSRGFTIALTTKWRVHRTERQSAMTPV